MRSFPIAGICVLIFHLPLLTSGKNNDSNALGFSLYPLHFILVETWKCFSCGSVSNSDEACSDPYNQYIAHQLSTNQTVNNSCAKAVFKKGSGDEYVYRFTGNVVKIQFDLAEKLKQEPDVRIVFFEKCYVNLCNSASYNCLNFVWLKAALSIVVMLKFLTTLYTQVL